jgi:ribosomal protein L18E
VTYYVGDEIVKTRTYEEGALITAPMIVCDKGYAVTAWKSASGDVYDFSSPITEPLDLYAELSLLPAVATVDRLSFTYDGEARELKISSLYHPLEYCGAYYKFEWYRNGVLLSESDTLEIKNVSDSGEYALKISFFFEEDSSSITYDGISVNVLPKAIAPPIIDDLIYANGALLTPNVEYSPYYTSEPIFVKGIGSYRVRLTLTDTENYRWSGAEGESISVDFNVVKDEDYVSTGTQPQEEYVETKNVRAVALLFLLSFLFAVGALVLIIVARKNTRVLQSASAVSAHKVDERDCLPDDIDEPRFSVQLFEDDTDDAEYRELTKTDAHRADLLMSDSMAKNMIKIIKDASADTAGKCALVSIGEINGKFYPNERVDIESLKARKIIDSDVGLVRITDDGEIDRPLKIYANDFSLTAVKMIVLTGGEVFRYQSRRF